MKAFGPWVPAGRRAQRQPLPPLAVKPTCTRTPEMLAERMATAEMLEAIRAGDDTELVRLVQAAAAEQNPGGTR